MTRLAPYVPDLDAYVEAARRAAAQGAAEGAPEPEQELQPAEQAAGADRGDESDAGEYTDVEVEPEDFPAEEAELAATISPPPCLDQPEQSQEGQHAQQDQVEVEVGAGDAASVEAGQQEEAEEEIVANFVLAPEGAASGAPEEFPLTTGNSPDAEVPSDDYEQDLDLVHPSPEPPVVEGDEAGIATVEGAAADVEIEGEPVAVQEEGAESEHPLAYVGADASESVEPL